MPSRRQPWPLPQEQGCASAPAGAISTAKPPQQPNTKQTASKEARAAGPPPGERSAHSVRAGKLRAWPGGYKDTGDVTESAGMKSSNKEGKLHVNGQFNGH